MNTETPGGLTWRDWALVVLAVLVVLLGVLFIIRSQDVTANGDRIAQQDALLSQTCLAGAPGEVARQFHQQEIGIDTSDGPVRIIACVRN